MLTKRSRSTRSIPGVTSFPFLWTLLVVLCATSMYAAATKPGSANIALIASDIHFNPMADASLVAQLEASEPEQWEGILARSKSTAFSQYGQDTNWWLLQSALDQMHKTSPHPAVIMLTGDSLAHHFPRTYQDITHDSDREHYRKFVLKTVKFLALEFRERYPDTNILLTPGNNDEECGNYSVEAGGRFLHDTADLARDLAHGDDAMRGSWEQLGSFNVPHPALKGVRIIALNTVLFSNLYHAAKFSEGCAKVSSDGPGQAFAWLQSQLKQAEAAHEKVWLMFHIPPGIDSYASIQKYLGVLKSAPQQVSTPEVCLSRVVPMWVPSWTAQIDTLLEKYRGTVIASFSGHTHVDDFRVLDPGSNDSPFVLITAAISPIYNQNPSFRTITFGKDGSILDSSVYYLTNLIYASKTTPGEWQQEYRFSQQWKLSGINGASLSSLYSRIASDENTRGDWLKLYNVSSSAAYVLPGSVPGLYCAAEALDTASYSRCYCPAETAGHAATSGH